MRLMDLMDMFMPPIEIAKISERPVAYPDPVGEQVCNKLLKEQLLQERYEGMVNNDKE